MRGWVALAIVLLAAGCMDGSEVLPPGDDQPELASATPPLPYEFVCDSTTVPRAQGVCASRITSASNQLTEPSLAVHPGNPDVMAVAAHGVGASSVVAGGRLVVPLLFVTEDGGASWRESSVPFTPLTDSPSDMYSDPAVVFTPNGTLVLAGLRVAQAGNMDHPPIVIALTSSDLGATWSQVQEFGVGGSNDREWLSVGPDGVVYLSWQDYPATSHVAWSSDEGATWTVLDDEPEGCYTGSAVGFVAGQPWFACQEEIDGQPGVNVYRILRSQGRLEQVSRIADMYSIAPRVLEAPNGGVIVTGFWDQVARSGDGGLTWEASRSIRDMVTIEDDWPGSVYVYWSAIDGNALHMMLAFYHRFPTQDPSDEHRVAHVVLDATTLEPVQEKRLTPSGPEASGADSGGSPIPSLGDDWYQMVASDGEVRLVWTWAGGIDVGHAVQR